jgi:membrane associated rhomboid family serine protease
MTTHSAREVAAFRARLRLRPWLTWALIAVNSFYSTAAILDERLNDNTVSLIEFGAKNRLLIGSGDWWRLVTAAFLHQGFLHLAINMYALWVLGSFCEVLYGRARYLLIYLGAALGGSLASYYLTDQNSVGASGAVFGLLGAALVLGFRHQKRLPAVMGRKLRGSLLFWLAVNLALGMLIPVIDNWGHLGGLVGGSALALFLGDLAFARGGQGLFARAAAATAAGLVLIALGAGGWNRLTVSYQTLASWAMAMDTREEADDPVGALSLLEDAAAGARGREPWLLLVELERARTLDELGAPAQAAELAAAAATSPAFKHADYPWAVAAADRFAERKRYGDAEQLYRRVLSTRRAADAANNLAWMYLTAEDSVFVQPATALALAELAADVEPANPFYLGTLGTAELRLSRHRSALEHLTMAVHLHEAGDESTDLYLLAIALAGMGHADQAEVVLEEAIENAPGDPFRTEAERAVRRKSLSI